jgi:hypothetical protein
MVGLNINQKYKYKLPFYIGILSQIKKLNLFETNVFSLCWSNRVLKL